MALKIGDNFSYQGQQPNFERDTFKTKAAMKAFPSTSIDEGHISLCLEDGKRYKYSSSNPNNSVTGRWKLVVDTALDESSEYPVQNKIIAAKFREHETNLANAIQEATELIESQGQDTEEKLDELRENIDETERITAEGLAELKKDLEELDDVSAAAINYLLRNKVSNTVTINGHELDEENIIITKSDIGLDKVENKSPQEMPVSVAQQNALDAKVDKETGKSLISTISLEKLNNLPSSTELDTNLGYIRTSISDHTNNTNNPHEVTVSQIGAVPTTRTVNSKSLDEDITLERGDVGCGDIEEFVINGGVQDKLDEKVDVSTFEENNGETEETISELENRASDLEEGSKVTADVLSRILNTISNNEGTTAAAINQLIRRLQDTEKEIELIEEYLGSSFTDFVNQKNAQENPISEEEEGGEGE